MWNSAHQFKVLPFILFLLLFAAAHSTPLREAGEIVLNDRAVFRVGNTAFMISDIEGHLKAIEILRCFSAPSYLLTSLGIGRRDMPSIPTSKQLNDNLTGHGDFLFKLLAMIKMETFANKQKVVTPANFTTQLGVAQCAGKKSWKKWPMRLRSLVHTELFLQGRYGGGAGVQAAAAGAGAGTGTGQISKQSREQIALFITTVGKKFSHNVFF